MLCHKSIRGLPASTLSCPSRFGIENRIYDFDARLPASAGVPRRDVDPGCVRIVVQLPITDNLVALASDECRRREQCHNAKARVSGSDQLLAALAAALGTGISAETPAQIGIMENLYAANDF